LDRSACGGTHNHVVVVVGDHHSGGRSAGKALGETCYCKRLK
jgi:hypothetical protein